MLKFSVSTDSRVCFKDITAEINHCIRDQGIESGICCIFTPHTTAAIAVNERADPHVIEDVSTALNTLIPFDDNYLHSEGNSAAHIKSSIIGPSEILPMERGRLILGTWQAVFFCEFDGPRRRSVLLKIIQDKL